MKKIEAVMAKITNVFGWIGAIGLCVAVALTTVDVILRFAVKTSIMGSYEMQQLIFLVIVLSAYSYTQTAHGHINVVFVIKPMPRRARIIIFAFASLLQTVISGWLVYAVFKQTFSYISSSYYTATAHIAMWPFYMFGGIATAVFCLTLILDCCRAIAAACGNEVIEEEITSEWV